MSELDDNVQESMAKVEEFNEKVEYAIDLDRLPDVDHNWIKRGIKVSCEGANHPYHSHFLVKR